MKRLPISIGQRFSRLVVTAEGRTHDGKLVWKCVCDCGNRRDVGAGAIFSGNTRSCGCYQREAASRASRIHGNARDNNISREYKAWNAMRQRCVNPKHSSYHRYGGRGITVCKRWNSFPLFFKDMGPKPSPKHSLDRIDTNGNYEPRNCRWATIDVQANNTRSNRIIAFNGERLTSAQWARKLGMNVNTLRQRLFEGWSDTRALSEPVRHELYGRRKEAA